VTFPHSPTPAPRPGPPPGGFRPGSHPGGPPPSPRPGDFPAARPGGFTPSRAPADGFAGAPGQQEPRAGAGGYDANDQTAGEGVPSTGHPAVDAVLRSLANAARLAPTDQIAEYEAAHQVLQETLSGIDG